MGNRVRYQSEGSTPSRSPGILSTKTTTTTSQLQAVVPSQLNSFYPSLCLFSDLGKGPLLVSKNTGSG